MFFISCTSFCSHGAGAVFLRAGAGRRNRINVGVGGGAESGGGALGDPNVAEHFNDSDGASEVGTELAGIDLSPKNSKSSDVGGGNDDENDGGEW